MLQAERAIQKPFISRAVGNGNYVSSPGSLVLEVESWVWGGVPLQYARACVLLSFGVRGALTGLLWKFQVLCVL